jgi:hypothetical protein
VLWLDASAFGRGPLGKLEATLRSFGLCDTARPPIVIIGPSGTDDLRAMVQDVLDANVARRDQPKGCLVETRLYSPFATAIGPDEHVRRRLGRAGIRFVPMIGSDRSLMPALRAELARRAAGPELPTHAVALVSELDTGYGREIEETVAAGLCGRGGGGLVAEGCRERIYTFKYLRGLDGLIPKRVPPKDPGTSEKPREGKPAAPSLEQLEKAEGDSQFDYLRRLATRIRREHERIVRYAGMDGFTSVGVFGSDLYDKLLVLQAIRREFPSAVFFTTDLDARFLHPREFQWTRNLVVASSFGLQLREEIQGAVPPFRNSYQTATFLAVTVALVNEIEQTAIPSAVVEGWFEPSQARIYEIGRTEAVDLSEARLGIQDARYGACESDLSRCAGIHPEPIFSDRPYPRTLRYWGLAGVSLLGLGLLTSSGMRRGIAESLRWCGGRPILSGALALLVLASIGAATFSAVREGPRGEPFRFFEGVSVWPTEIIRVAALVVAIAGIVMCEIRRARTRRALQARYFEGVVGAQDRGPRLAELVSVWRRVFAGKPRRRTFRDLSYIDTAELWREYFFQSAPVAHWTRVIVGSALFFALGACVVLALTPPVVPARGAVARIVDWVLIG